MTREEGCLVLLLSNKCGWARLFGMNWNFLVSAAFDADPFSCIAYPITGAALVTVLPDDSVPGIALETFVAFPLLFVIPAVCAVGGFALTGLK